MSGIVQLQREQLNDALIAAAKAGDKENVLRLIGEGADVNASDNDGMPLHRASENGHVDVVKVLIDNGADVNAKDNDGKTPLDVAKSNNNHSIVKLLDKPNQAR